MKSWATLALTWILVACASSHDRALDDFNRSQASLAKSKADQEQRNAETRRAWKEREARDRDERQAAAHADEAQKAKDTDARCATSRAERLSDVKDQIRAWQALIARAKPHLKWIDAHCKVEDTRGVLVQREHTKEGVIVRTKQVGAEAEARCDAPKPRGLDSDDVGALVMNTGDEVLYNGDFFDANGECTDSDMKAGLNLFVHLDDFDGQKAILAK